MLVKKYTFFLLLIFCCLVQQVGYGQCTAPINSFPYNEGFEANDGNWVRSSSSHWEWGQIISKSVITAAAGGTKCWIVGGFSGGQYNSGNSFLQSPCFDISSLTNPQISFKIFWETEKKYDGVSFEFSLDGGTIWNTLGSINSNSDCNNQNWFNYNPVNTLGVAGWSGNIQPTSGSCQGGGGSGSWLTARHSLAAISGATGVMFRFSFGAGTTCNNFDGFAIDDIHIGEAPVTGADFTYACSMNRLVDFTSSITGCKTSVSWDFQDTGSGADNNSTLDNPVHTFSSPGDYMVTMTVNFLSGPPITVTKNVKIITLTATVPTGITCNGEHTGEITINVSPAGTYNYVWDTNPPQTTPTINNLAGGDYTVIVTGTNTCSTSMEVVLSEPAPMGVGINIFDARCNGNNGSITTTATGGTAPYAYTWSNAATTSAITNLAPGSYALLLQDANGCTINTTGLQVGSTIVPVNISVGNDTSICPGDKLILSPGNFASYLWQDNTTSPSFTVTATGTYSVMVTDIDGCAGSASINVIVDCSEIFFPSAFTPNSDGRNDGFGPLPRSALASLKNYKLTVYGRWGEVIFQSTDPYKQWDGTYKGKPLPTQVCTWVAGFGQRNYLSSAITGTIIIVR